MLWLGIVRSLPPCWLFEHSLIPALDPASSSVARILLIPEVLHRFFFHDPHDCLSVSSTSGFVFLPARLGSWSLTLASSVTRHVVDAYFQPSTHILRSRPPHHI